MRGTPRYFIGRIPSLKPRVSRIEVLTVDRIPEKKALLFPGLGTRPERDANSVRAS